MMLPTKLPAQLAQSVQLALDCGCCSSNPPNPPIPALYKILCYMVKTGWAVWADKTDNSPEINIAGGFGRVAAGKVRPPLR
jgi:hypothetical protein